MCIAVPDGSQFDTLVIFDCDGVLVDSETLSNRLLAETVSRMGVPTSEAEARRRFQGRLLTDVGREIAGTLGHEPDPSWIAEYNAARFAMFRRDLRPVPGAREALEALHAQGDVAMCVATQGTSEKTRLTLGLCGLRRFFRSEELFSAQALGVAKPDPGLFLHAQTAMAAPAGHRLFHCVVVEDGVLGVMAARAAGMPVLGLAHDAEHAEELERLGAAVISSMRELPGRVATLRTGGAALLEGR